MKKFVSIILSLMLLMTLSVSASADESAVGTWYLHQATLGDITLDAASLGMVMTITLNEDGTATGYSSVNGEESNTSGTWTQDGASVTIVFDGDPAQNATLADGTLTITEESSGVSLICTQEPPVASETAAYVPGAPREDAALSDYLGQWECLLAESDGQQLETAALNLVMQLTIAEDGIVYYVNNAGTEITADFSLAFADGVVTAMQGDEALWALQLLDDGVIVLAIDALSYYFTPVVEAPAA